MNSNVRYGEPNSDLWEGLIRRLEGILGERYLEIVDEKTLTKILREGFGLDQFGEKVGIYDPKAKGKCTRLLLVPCSLKDFEQRAFGVLEIARECKSRLQGVIFLPLTFGEQYEKRLRDQVAPMLRDYDVKQVCIKSPLSAPARCYTSYPGSKSP